MKSLSEKQSKNLPTELIQTLKQTLGSLPDTSNQAETLNHWISLFQNKKFHFPVAKRSLKYSTEEIEKYNHTKIDQVLAGDFCTIESCSIYRGEALTQIWIAGLLLDVFDLVTVGKKIELPAIKTLSGLIVSEFGWLTIPDIKLALTRGAIGKYGEIYDRLDVPVIMGWIKAYSEERLITSEARRRATEARHKQDETIPMPKEIQDKLNQMIKDNAEKKLKARHDGPIHNLVQYAERYLLTEEQAEEDLSSYLETTWNQESERWLSLGFSEKDFRTTHTRIFFNIKSQIT